MAEEHPLALSLSVKGKSSLPGTAEASVKRKVTPETERARRRIMSGLYAELAALLPGLPARATRTRILEETVKYVGALRATAAELEARRVVAGERSHAEAARTDRAGAGVHASVEASCFAVRLPEALRAGTLTRVLEVFQRHGVAVLAATVTSNGGDAAVTVTTSALAPGVVERIKADISSSIP